MAGSLMRRAFRPLNRFFMVPAFRLGLGRFMGSPATGYIMVVRTVGSRTGRERFTPVNYAIANGAVYFMSGWGSSADWYRNLRRDSHVELTLPSGRATGDAEEVTDPTESLDAARRILRNAGFAGFLAGLNPLTASDETIRAKTAGLPVLRVRAGVRPGPGDPGSRQWLWWLAAGAALLALRRARATGR